MKIGIQHSEKETADQDADKQLSDAVEPVNGKVFEKIIEEPLNALIRRDEQRRRHGGHRNRGNQSRQQVFCLARVLFSVRLTKRSARRKRKAGKRTKQQCIGNISGCSLFQPASLFADRKHPVGAQHDQKQDVAKLDNTVIRDRKNG